MFCQMTTFPRRSCTRTYGRGRKPVQPKRIPHLLGPSSVWRKCNLVIPTTVTMDPLMKYQWLTKTSVIRGLPSRITDCAVDKQDIKDVEERVSQTLAFQTRQKFGDKEIAAGVLQNMFSPLWKHASDYNHLLNSSLACYPKIECYWRRKSVNYITILKPAYVFHTSNPLELFVEPSFSRNNIPPVEYTARSMNMFMHPFNRITVFGGFSRHSNFPFGHTVLCVDSSSVTEEQVSSRALITLFAQAAAQSVQDGHKLDEDLSFPLASQGIFTNGQWFAYFCYQLNTLDLRSNKKCWNVFYVGPVMKLFESVVPGEGLQHFNPDCAKLFLQFMLQRTTRQHPKFDGFQLVRQVKEKQAKEGKAREEKYWQQREEYWQKKKGTN
ncbi:large ribosomal subunit protein mL65-like [Dysidea avara]|uniref:large ribosomal subunit protein mL65-like n=1 Tax=Dysidea avara TaxID=196820 RepID=UPI00332286E7